MITARIEICFDRTGTIAINKSRNSDIPETNKNWRQLSGGNKFWELGVQKGNI